MCGEDRHTQKKTKTKKQNSTTTKNNGDTKRCIEKEPCNAVFLITDESLMHFRDSLSDDHSRFSFLASSPCRDNDQFTKHTHRNDRKKPTIAHIDKTNNYSLMEANCWWMENLELRVHFKEKFMS